MEKIWRKRFDEVKDKIMDGYRRGACNKDGVSVKVNGRAIAKPRHMRGSVVKCMCNKCNMWYYSNEEHNCES